MQPYLYNIQIKTYIHNATLLVQHTGKNLQPQSLLARYNV